MPDAADASSPVGHGSGDLHVLASYHWLGFLMGNSVADDAKWATVFLANVHFADLGTQYFSSQAPPSPLQHMWSLSVEEQFYFVWPVLVLFVATLLAASVFVFGLVSPLD